MISDYRCFYCFARAFEELLVKENFSPYNKNSFTHEFAALYARKGSNCSAPEFLREAHAILRKYNNDADPFVKEKKKSNDLVLKMYPELKSMILKSEDPFNTALRLAIAGNIIDFGVSSTFDLKATIDKVLKTGFAIDHSAQLKEAISKAQTVLYLGDNAGEIVFDKLLIEHIMHPNLYYAVRGKAVINDATIEDAKYIGMDVVADVISNGDDAPSTILKYCSPEFNDLFERADLIISKGQGNMEGLMGKTKKTVYYLLMAKCDFIANALMVKKGDFVVKKNYA
jgi:damage-control phosphatase, subfamily I